MEQIKYKRTSLKNGTNRVQNNQYDIMLKYIFNKIEQTKIEKLI